MSSFIAGHRLALWILLVVLSATILVFPVSVRYVYAPIESMSIFGSKLPLFSVIFIIWALLFFSLLFTKAKNNDWQRLGLLCLFSLVFLGFWTIKTPFGGQQDEVWNLGHVQYLIDTGKIAFGHPNLQYFQFPALHLDIFAISQFSNIGLFATRIVFMLSSSILLPALLYMLFSRILKDSRLASLAVILMLLGSLMAKFQVFWPGNMAFIFLIALLALLYRRDDQPALEGISYSGLVVTLTLFTAFVVSYLPTPLYFIFIVLGIYGLQIFLRKELVRTPLLILFVILLGVWSIFWATGIFTNLSSTIPTFIKGLSDPFSRFNSVTGAGTGYVGASIPLWATLTRYFWLALIFGAGGILTAVNLIKIKKVNTEGIIATGGLLGIVVFSGIIYLAIPVAQWARILVIAPLFTIPVIMGYVALQNRNNIMIAKKETWIAANIREYLPYLLIASCFVFALPTFLTHESSFTTIAIYPYDISTGEYLKSSYSDNNILKLYSDYSAYIYTDYIPEAQYRVTDSPEKFVVGTALWQNLDQLENDYNGSNNPFTLFILTERFLRPSGHPAEIKPDDPNWLAFVARLQTHSRIYINGHSEIYGN